MTAVGKKSVSTGQDNDALAADQISTTVVIPCSRRPDMLEQAVTSVKEQSVAARVVIVDDCALPEDSSRIREIGADTSAQIVRLSERHGPAVARNAGIAASTTRYIAFLDADDVWLPGKLALQIQSMEAANLDFSYMLYANVSGEVARAMPAPLSLTRHDLLGNTAIGCSTVMLRRSFVGQRRFSEAPVEDLAFWASLLGDHGVAHLVGSEVMVLRNSGGRSANKLAAGFRCWRTMRGEIGLPLLSATRYFASYAAHAVNKHWMPRGTKSDAADFKGVEL